MESAKLKSSINDWFKLVFIYSAITSPVGYLIEKFQGLFKFLNIQDSTLKKNILDFVLGVSYSKYLKFYFMEDYIVLHSLLDDPINLFKKFQIFTSGENRKYEFLESMFYFVELNEIKESLNETTKNILNKVGIDSDKIKAALSGLKSSVENSQGTQIKNLSEVELEAVINQLILTQNIEKDTLDVSTAIRFQIMYLLNSSVYTHSMLNPPSSTMLNVKNLGITFYVLYSLNKVNQVSENGINSLGTDGSSLNLDGISNVIESFINQYM